MNIRPSLSFYSSQLQDHRWTAEGKLQQEKLQPAAAAGTKVVQALKHWKMENTILV